MLRLMGISQRGATFQSARPQHTCRAPGVSRIHHAPLGTTHPHNPAPNPRTHYILKPLSFLNTGTVHGFLLFASLSCLSSLEKSFAREGHVYSQIKSPAIEGWTLLGGKETIHIFAGLSGKVSSSLCRALRRPFFPRLIRAGKTQTGLPASL
ncbi:hypothetical protein MHYP_G00114740 [Metynnis hypsauchen]